MQNNRSWTLHQDQNQKRCPIKHIPLQATSFKVINQHFILTKWKPKNILSVFIFLQTSAFYMKDYFFLFEGYKKDQKFHGSTVLFFSKLWSDCTLNNCHLQQKGAWKQ